MICVSLAEESLDSCLAALKDTDCAEIRIDRMQLALDDIRTLFSQPKTLIATCRPGSRIDKDRKKLLIAAIESGATFIDVEVESEKSYREEIVAKARLHECRVIISFHDRAGTPERHVLQKIVDCCFEAGADIAKIACNVRSREENARLLGLLDDSRKIIVVGMGDKGKITRVVASFLGSPFTFASVKDGKETAEGQLDREMLMTVIGEVKRAIA